MTELREFIEWLTEYAEKPLDQTLVRIAERRDLPIKTLLSLGHGAALVAVTGKVQEILRKRAA